jgi:hypothetical protein
MNTIDCDYPILTGIVYSVLTTMLYHDLPVNRSQGPRQHLRLLRDDDRPLRRQLQLQHQQVGDVRATVHPDGRGRALALHPQVEIEARWVATADCRWWVASTAPQ